MYLIMNCLYCQKEIISKRGTKKFCDASCRQGYFRTKDSVTKVVPVSVTKSGISVTKKDSVTELRFTTEPIEERVKQYKDLYPNSTFVPNWVAHGFNSKEDAIKNAISEVQKNKGIVDLGIGID